MFPVVFHFAEGERAVEVDGNLSLLQGAKNAGVALNHQCKQGTCGKCKVKVVAGAKNLTPPTRYEDFKLGRQQLKLGYRLACQAKATGPVEVAQ